MNLSDSDNTSSTTLESYSRKKILRGQLLSSIRTSEVNKHQFLHHLYQCCHLSKLTVDLEILHNLLRNIFVKPLK